MRQLSQVLTVLAAAATTVAASPQNSTNQAELSKDVDLATPQGVVHFDTDDDGAHWIMGDTYKAKVSPEGFTYIPFLGSEAPRNYPVDMRLASANAGDGSLDLSSQGTVTRTKSRFVIDRGPVQVIYDFRAEGVEQSFLFDEGLSGALEFELEVQSELSSQADGAGYRWFNALGGVNYGEAVALDQDGSEEPVSTTLSGGRGDTQGTVRLRHHVSAEFVRAASGAVLVDPSITTIAVGGSTKATRNSDAAYDAQSDRHMVVFEELFSATDRDIRKRHIDATSGSQTRDAYLDFTYADVTSPSVAHVISPNVFLVAANESFSSGTRARVMGRRVSGSGVVLGGWKTLVNSSYSSNESYMPKLGGDNGFSGVRQFGLVTRTLVGDYADIEFHRISPFYGTPILGSGRRLARTLNSTLREVEISRTTGDRHGDREWVVAALEVNSTTNEARVRVQTIRHDGVVDYFRRSIYYRQHPEYLRGLSVSAMGAQRSPTTGSPYYLVTLSAGFRGLAVLCSGGTAHDTEYLTNLLHQDFSFRDSLVTNRAIKDGWIVAQGTSWTSWLGYGVRLTTLSPVGDELAVRDRRVSMNAHPYSGFSVATKYEGGGVNSSGAIVLWSDRLTGHDRVRGAIATDFSPRAAGFQTCRSYANSTLDYGFIQASGDGSTDTPKLLLATGLPPMEWGFVIASPTLPSYAGPWSGSGGRLCMQDPRYLPGSVQRVSGAGTLTLMLQHNQLPTAAGLTSAMSGESWHFQALYHDHGDTNLTNMVTIPYE